MTQGQLPGMEEPERGGALEFYPTPQPLCDAVCDALVGLMSRYGPHLEVVEPSAGTGNFVRAARQSWPRSHITAIEPQDTREACLAAGADAYFRSTLEDAPALTDADLVLGNPPFLLAAAHVGRLLRELPQHALVAFLLRLSFWETPDRARLFEAHPLFAFAPVVERPDFSGQGGDSMGVGLFVWRAGGRAGGYILPPISWK
jgi:hypothetical protein